VPGNGIVRKAAETRRQSERIQQSRVAPYRDTIEHGAPLMAYGGDLAAMERQLAGQVVQVLRGAKPADIPIEQVSKLVFVINLKTAEAIGFTFSSALIAQADEVIE